MVLAVLVGWAGVIAWRRKKENQFFSSGQTPQTPSGVQGGSAQGALPRMTDDPDIDRAALEQAERELGDLETDVKGRPLEDQLGDDWGPGTPKPPYV